MIFISVKPFMIPGAIGRVHAANQQHGQKAKLNLPQRIAKGIGRRSAAGGDDVAHAAQAEAHADFAGERAHGPAGNAEQAHVFHVAGEPQPHLLLGELLRAAARAQHHADLALLLQR